MKVVGSEYWLMHKNIRVCFRDIKTHSFIENERKLLQYVRNRELVNPDRTEMDFSIYYKDISERHNRVPELEKLYNRKRESLNIFRKGKDIWKDSVWR